MLAGSKNFIYFIILSDRFVRVAFSSYPFPFVREKKMHSDIFSCNYQFKYLIAYMKKNKSYRNLSPVIVTYISMIFVTFFYIIIFLN